MGQYYKPVIEQGGLVKIFDRSVLPEKEYVMAKLMEHSWWENPTCNAVAKMLFEKSGRVFWCGDYAEDSMAKWAWNDDRELSLENPEDFTLNNKYILNYDKKVYLDCNKYKKASIDSDGWIIHPLPLLTALGNGLGGGDYWGINKDEVGKWAGDELEIIKERPNSMEEFEIIFKEG